MTIRLEEMADQRARRALARVPSMAVMLTLCDHFSPWARLVRAALRLEVQTGAGANTVWVADPYIPGGAL